MKKSLHIIFFCFILITSSWVDAQEKQPNQLLLGSSVGMTFSSVKFVPKVDNEQFKGGSWGATIRYDHERGASLQMEINYTQSGWNEVFDEPNYTFSKQLNYLEVPLFTHLYFGSKRIRYFLNIGPKISFLLNDKIKDTSDSFPNNHINQQHILPIQNKVDWGLAGGPGIEIRTGIGYFTLDFRYYYAFGDIFHTKRKDFFGTAARQTLEGRISYLIPINL